MMPSNATCPIDGCDNPTPWDMVALNFDGQYFCSPGCAREHLEGMNRVPELMTLHDPQYYVERDEMPGVEDEAVDIQRPVQSRDDAFIAIDEIEAMVPGEFRVEPAV